MSDPCPLCHHGYLTCFSTDPDSGVVCTGPYLHEGDHSACGPDEQAGAHPLRVWPEREAA